MDDAEFKKYVDLVMSMCTDFLMDGLKKSVFSSNLKMITEQLNMEYPIQDGDNIPEWLAKVVHRGYVARYGD